MISRRETIQRGGHERIATRPQLNRTPSPPSRVDHTARGVHDEFEIFYTRALGRTDDRAQAPKNGNGFEVKPVKRPNREKRK